MLQRSTQLWLRSWAGWIVTVVLILVLPTFFWLLQPAVTSVDTLGQALLVMARASAFVGLAAFAWSLVLGARLHWVDWLFQGMDRVIKVHHYVGAYSFGAIAVHVLSVTAMAAVHSPASALHLWTPGPDNYYVTYGILSFIAMVALFVVTIAIEIRYDWFLKLHWILGVLFFPAAHHAFGAGAVLADNEYMYYYLAGLSALGGLAFLYGTLFAPPFIKRYPYVVSSVRQLGHGLTEILLRPTWRPLIFKPGQFAYLRFTDAKAVSSERHPFSFASSSKSRFISFVIKDLGDYTKDLADLKPGRKATLMGPYGVFSYMNIVNRKQIWIAGGIGVTPFLSMVRSMSHRSRHSIDFYYCTKTKEEAVFLDEIQRLTRHNDNFHIHHICEETDGFLDVEGIKKSAFNDIYEADMFICGPPAMLSNMTRQFKEEGIPDHRVHYEDFSFA